VEPILLPHLPTFAELVREMAEKEVEILVCFEISNIAVLMPH